MMPQRLIHTHIIALNERHHIENIFPQFKYFFRAGMQNPLSPCGDKNAQHSNETVITLLFMIPTFRHFNHSFNYL